VRRIVASALVTACLVVPVTAKAQGQDKPENAPAPSSGDPQPPTGPSTQAPPSPEQQPPVAEPVELKPVSETGRTGLEALIHDTAYDFKHFVTDKEPLLWMAGGGVAAFAVHPLDDNVNERLESSGAIHNFFLPGKFIGYGAVQIGAAVGTWAIGRAIDKHGRAAHIGLDLLRAQIVTQTFTYGLKYSVQRDRPDGTSGYSFPSGHASTTFATASVLERHFGWRAGIPMYALATYVATSRLHENRHYLSDVVFGGAVGLAAGRTVTRHGRSTFTMVPLLAPHGGVGVAVVALGHG
jgi:hypothetical protein